MAFNGPYPSVLLWLDMETTALPPKGTNDFSDVYVMEISVIATDFDLKPYFGYEGVVGMTDEMKASLGRNPEVVQIHLKNGLLKASKESTDTLRVIESEIVGMLQNKTSQNKGEFIIAGSGVAAFDHPLIKEKMPELASWLTYYPADIGVVRRLSKILSGGRDVITPVQESFAEGVKAHRSTPDVQADIKLAKEFQKLFHWVVDEQNKA
jgi:oligoribonuclease (3'-5' exoribonuclease)